MSLSCVSVIIIRLKTHYMGIVMQMYASDYGMLLIITFAQLTKALKWMRLLVSAGCLVSLVSLFPALMLLHAVSESRAHRWRVAPADTSKTGPSHSLGQSGQSVSITQIYVYFITTMRSQINFMYLLWKLTLIQFLSVKPVRF